MSIHIVLDSPPGFYTNLDVIQGRVILRVGRQENIGAIIVKLEGESKTALAVPPDGPRSNQGRHGQTGDIVFENHKILYKVSQVFPDENVPALAPIMLPPGQHEFPFNFKIPFNNACSDPRVMANLGGIAGAGGYGSGPGIFGLGGIRVMDGSRQLLYSHVTRTLPPSFTGFPRQAEIRYYVKVTVQRPGLFKENWRYNLGFKFLPIEPPRPPPTKQEAYARRPFTFRPPSPARHPSHQHSPPSFFSGGHSPAGQAPVSPNPASGVSDEKLQPPQSSAAPSIEMSARLPHPSVLTCNKPVPLRLIAKKLAPAPAEIFLTSLQIELLGVTQVRCQELINTETNRWVITSQQGLSISVSQPNDEVGTEVIVPDTIWRDVPLPNTVMPSFVTCNLSRSYQLEVKVGLSCGHPLSPASSSTVSSFFKGMSRSTMGDNPQAIHLPLHFSNVEVFSGLAPPASLVEAMRQQQQQRRTSQQPNTTPLGRPQAGSSELRPPIPPRPSAQQRPVAPPRPHDPLYPPQLAPGEELAAYADAPPSYDEAMAESMAGPAVPSGSARPAYSGVTNENGPSTMPEKS